jgi:putative membrane protein
MGRMQPFMPHPDVDRFLWVSAVTRLAVLVLIIVGIVLLVRYMSHRYPAGGHFHAHGTLPPGAAPPQSSTALQILEERFARGEIDDDEFRRRKEALLS